MKGTKLILQIGDNIASVESSQEDCDASEIMSMLAGVMVSQTWIPETIYQAMKDYGEEHLDEN